jgi:septal ring factor EnvC (AmiA/AmiB activator)
MYDIDQKEKYVKYVDSENRCLNKEISCLEAQLEQVTASLTHFVEDKSTSKERMHTHTDSQVRHYCVCTNITD